MAQRRRLVVGAAFVICGAAVGLLLLWLGPGHGRRTGLEDMKSALGEELARRGRLPPDFGAWDDWAVEQHAHSDGQIRSALMAVALDRNVRLGARLETVDSLLALTDHALLYETIVGLFEYKLAVPPEVRPVPDAEFRMYAGAKVRNAVLDSDVLPLDQRRDLVGRFLPDDLALWTAMAEGAEIDPRSGRPFDAPLTAESVERGKAQGLWV